MNKLLKKGLITVVFLGVLGYAAFRIVINETKKNSPQDIAAFVDDDLEIQVVYCQPLKKGEQFLAQSQKELYNLMASIGGWALMKPPPLKPIKL